MKINDKYQSRLFDNMMAIDAKDPLFEEIIEGLRMLQRRRCCQIQILNDVTIRSVRNNPEDIALRQQIISYTQNLYDNTQRSLTMIESFAALGF